MDDIPPTRLLLLTMVAALIIGSTRPVSNAGYVGAYNVKVTDNYVTSTARCSCSLSTGYGYSTNTFMNYCPNCHRYGTLHFEQGHGWTSPEGLWYCSCCDMDFCLVHGKSHDGRGYFLTRTSINREPKKSHKHGLQVARSGGKIVSSPISSGEFTRLFTAFFISQNLKMED